MIGRTISHYHFLEKLGGGGTGVVLPPRDSPASDDQPAKKEVTLVVRIKNVFRRLTSRGPCAGVGCG